MRKTWKAIVKGLTWRFFAAFDTMLVTAIVMFVKTGTVGVGVFGIVAGIVGMELVTKTFLYTIHEKVWETPLLTKFFG